MNWTTRACGACRPRAAAAWPWWRRCGKPRRAASSPWCRAQCRAPCRPAMRGASLTPCWPCARMTRCAPTWARRCCTTSPRASRCAFAWRRATRCPARRHWGGSTRAPATRRTTAARPSTFATPRARWLAARPPCSAWCALGQGPGSSAWSCQRATALWRASAASAACASSTWSPLWWRRRRASLWAPPWRAFSAWTLTSRS